MKYLITLFLIFSLILISVSVCYADRICIQKSTGEYILTTHQSGGINDLMADGTLPSEEIKAARINSIKREAINAGFKENDIEVKDISPQEWAVIKKPMDEATQKTKALEDLIQGKIREQAIKELQAEGKLDVSGEIIK